MKKMHDLGILIVLIAGFTVTAVVAQEQVALTVHIHDGSLNGSLLSGVQVTGQDAGGNSFETTTNSDGSALIGGTPGTWAFTFMKEGYETLNLSYDVTETQDAAAYLERASGTWGPETQGVVLTVHVHDGSLNGTSLAGVLVAGQDAGGNGFEATTDSDGTAVIGGTPGTWAFTFTKEGYKTLNLSYDVTETQDAAAYLETADGS